jgi:hypothetical protein
VKYNRLSIWDIDAETGVNRSSDWMSVYSPIDKYSDNSDSKFPFDSHTASGHYSWNGLPGSGLGGMAPKTVSPAIWQVGSKQDSYVRITDIPIQARSTKSLFGQNYTYCPSDFGLIDARLSDEEGVPVGTIEIPSTDFNSNDILQNCILVYGRWMLELGDIQSGQTLKITKTTPRRDLRELLIPSKALEDDNLRRVAAYNPQSGDLEYIVRVMSLHRALGGYESTGLHHAYQPSLDMSGLLTADRVLLLGTIQGKEKPDYPTHIFRLSFPITLTERSLRWRGERYDPKPGDALDENMRPGLLQRPVE